MSIITSETDKLLNKLNINNPNTKVESIINELKNTRKNKLKLINNWTNNDVYDMFKCNTRLNKELLNKIKISSYIDGSKIIDDDIDNILLNLDIKYE